MKTLEQIQNEIDFQHASAGMWDAIASLPLQGRAPLDATLRAVTHRECAKALERRIKIRTFFYGAYIFTLIGIGVGLYVTFQ